MVDETKRPEDRPETTANYRGGSSPVGYCQECGRPLTLETLHRLSNGVFCTPCVAQREPSGGWQYVNGAASPRAGRAPSMPPAVGEPNPGFACMLGFIPGVGAMYNGQYAKGAMHLIVFVVLVTMADNLNWVFYWLVWGWVFYQVFEAYHTAKARRDGQPLPNPFGWNDIGERLGFNRPVTTATPPFRGTAPDGFDQRQPDANWAGYVPPTAFAPRPAASPFRNPYAEPAPSANDNPYTAPYDTPPPPTSPAAGPTRVPYTPTYVGSASSPSVTSQSSPASSRRFPVGALWLIGLGVLFLMGNMMPGFRLSGRWLVPVLLAGLALWSALRRWQQFQSSPAFGTHPSLACSMTGPSVLLTVATLLALDAGDVLAMRRSWPVLLVVWGGMQLLQRASSSSAPPEIPQPEIAAPMPPPVRSTSGTGSLGL